MHSRCAADTHVAATFAEDALHAVTVDSITAHIGPGVWRLRTAGALRKNPQLLCSVWGTCSLSTSHVTPCCPVRARRGS
jgi:hypothetical protein